MQLWIWVFIALLTIIYQLLRFAKVKTSRRNYVRGVEEAGKMLGLVVAVEVWLRFWRWPFCTLGDGGGGCVTGAVSW